MHRLAAALVLCLFSCVILCAAEDDHPIVTQVKEKLKDPAKPFTLGIRLKIKADKGKDFEAAFAPALKETRKEKGCLAYDLNKSSDDESIYVLYERWTNLPALATHLKTPHMEKLLASVHDYFEGSPEIRVFFPAAE
jgi:quinol monooxygenase YgiN